MTIFFSPNKVCFYDDDVNSVIPDDAYEFNAQDRDALLSGVSHGRYITVVNGVPTLVEPVMSVADIQARIAGKRYERETAGLVINGLTVDTSDRSKTLINGSALKALRNPNYIMNWKTADGFINLSADQILSIADAISDYVQACFDREEELLASLANGTFTDTMLDEGWPQ